MRLENFAFVVNRDNIGLDTAIQRVKIHYIYLSNALIWILRMSIYFLPGAD